MQDGATSTFDLFEPLAEHRTGGDALDRCPFSSRVSLSLWSPSIEDSQSQSAPEKFNNALLLYKTVTQHWV